MLSGADAVIVGRGPAGLLLSSLVLQNGGSVDLVAGAQGTMPLWGGHWDFRNYTDSGEAIRDPYAWWKSESDQLRGGSVDHWHRRWTHLANLWREAGIPVNTPKLHNQWLMTPLGHLRPTYLVPDWHFVVNSPQPITLVHVPGLTDFHAESVAIVYEWITGKSAHIVRLDSPPGWTDRWNALDWAWYFDSAWGREWLLQAMKSLSLTHDEVVVFPQILGMDDCDGLIRDLTECVGQAVAEVPLPPPAVGGIRIQRRWEAWLRRHGLTLTSGWVTSVEGNAAVLANGRKIYGDSIIMATGGILGGGFMVEPSGVVKDVVLGDSVGSINGKSLSDVGYPTWDRTVPVVGRMVEGWNPDRWGDGGAMNLWTVHEVFQALDKMALTKEGW